MVLDRDHVTQTYLCRVSIMNLEDHSGTIRPLGELEGAD
jgi:hypothetical protein